MAIPSLAPPKPQKPNHNPSWPTINTSKGHQWNMMDENKEDKDPFPWLPYLLTFVIGVIVGLILK